MIWEPFLLALLLGLLVSAGLYFAYLWPSVEPLEEGEASDADPDADRAPAPAPAPAPAADPADPADEAAAT